MACVRGCASSYPSMKRNRRRKCLFCCDLYMPGRHNAYHQKYCSKSACQTASREVSRRRWLAKPENRNYHCGACQTARVRAWRKTHPGYWRRKTTALQDLFLSQDVASEGVESVLNAPTPASCIPLAPTSPMPQDPEGERVAGYQGLSRRSPDAAGAGRHAVPLQDLCLSQDPLFVGFIAMLTDTLQDEIVPVMAKMQTLGLAMLGKGPGIDPKGRSHHAYKETCAVRRADAAGARAV
jgi:hypothetical protein